LADKDWASEVAAVKPSPRRLMYSLYGVVEHSGTLRSGHFTAYIKQTCAPSSDQLTNATSRCLRFLQSVSASHMNADLLVRKYRSQMRQSSSASCQLKPASNGMSSTDCCSDDKTELRHTDSSEPRVERSEAPVVSLSLGCGESRWLHVSDSSVVQVKLSNVLNCQAYMLFYERIS